MTLPHWPGTLCHTFHLTALAMIDISGRPTRSPNLFQSLPELLPSQYDEPPQYLPCFRAISPCPCTMSSRIMSRFQITTYWLTSLRARVAFPAPVSSHSELSIILLLWLHTNPSRSSNSPSRTATWIRVIGVAVASIPVLIVIGCTICCKILRSCLISQTSLHTCRAARPLAFPPAARRSLIAPGP